jgi:hypothetical protein
MDIRLRRCTGMASALMRPTSSLPACVEDDQQAPGLVFQAGLYVNRPSGGPILRCLTTATRGRPRERLIAPRVVTAYRACISRGLSNLDSRCITHQATHQSKGAGGSPGRPRDSKSRGRHSERSDFRGACGIDDNPRGVREPWLAVECPGCSRRHALDLRKTMGGVVPSLGW